MEKNITQGIFIRLVEDYSDELTKLSKIYSIARGNELYKKFEVIRINKSKEKDNTGKELYNIVLTIEYAYDALNLIEKYCDVGYSTNRYGGALSSKRPKYYINRHPERKEFIGISMDEKQQKIRIKNSDLYYSAEITNTCWNPGAYNLFLKSSGIPQPDKKFWFISRPPNAHEQYEELTGKPYDENNLEKS